jgi:hypothetical protein
VGPDQERWRRKSAHRDKWTLCGSNRGLSARESRDDHQQETTAEPLTGVQGQGGGGHHQGDKTLAELAKLTVPPAVDLKELHAKIGQLALENDLLAGTLTKAGMLSAKR